MQVSRGTSGRVRVQGLGLKNLGHAFRGLGPGTASKVC